MENTGKIPIVYCGGTFDLPHVGHVDFLRMCSRLGKVVVSLNTDEFVKEFKGKKPIMSYEEREVMLLSNKYVYGVIPNMGGADSKIAISHVRPDIIAIGQDWAEKDYYKQMGFTQQWLNENDIVLVYLPRTIESSTTKIKKRVRK